MKNSCLDSTQGDAPLGTSDIVCDDVDYFSSETGVRFKKCEECLQASKAVNGSESDSSRFLYNLRYASATCLFDYPKHRANSTASCDLDTACKPLQTAVETGLGTQAGDSDFSYCSADDSAFYGSNIDNCVTCLQSSSSSYVANFLVALQAGCEQQRAPGVLLGLSGEIFSEQPVNITSAASNSTAVNRGGDREELSTAAIVGIAIGATALFVIAIILFTVYWYRQKRYEREDKRIADRSAFYAKEQGSGSYMASITSGNSKRPAPDFTIDHRAPPPSYAPPGAQDLGMGVMNNAEYYDRIDGKIRGRPLTATVTKPQHQHRQSTETFDSASHVDTAALPTHPAYIPRDRAAGTSSRLGSRASRNSTPSIRSEPRFTKPDPYTIQVYMNGVDDAKNNAAAAPSSQEPPGPRADGINRDVGINRQASVRNIQIELAGPPESTASAPRPSISDSVATLRQGGGRATPIPPQGGRTTPIPRSSSSAQGGIDGGLRHGTPALAHPLVSTSLSSSSSSPDKDTFGSTGPGAGAGDPPRVPSLILPTVPRIRVPNKKPLKLVITGASLPEKITGPLAFPDSRFSTPPPPAAAQDQDRIIEQTVDRGGRSMEVAIGSGKSYLYG
ncbi:putative exo-alpha-sialidase neuraminidase [Diaporthe ampelina]|uniref:Putative exo-alpha-sialidase neuraminidase n=1 Tax=Diaporthe ampelina TaxID=1214573 RepID=A0A0G2FG50_9PEZI|nr:putative exo-alpha-sialidase neuraminidase [Diaporthe ampelina]